MNKEQRAFLLYYRQECDWDRVRLQLRGSGCWELANNQLRVMDNVRLGIRKGWELSFLPQRMIYICWHFMQTVHCQYFIVVILAICQSARLHHSRIVIWKTMFLAYNSSLDNKVLLYREKIMYKYSQCSNNLYEMRVGLPPWRSTRAHMWVYIEHRLRYILPMRLSPYASQLFRWFIAMASNMWLSGCFHNYVARWKL